jgi:type IV pilus assembly protein PilM
MAANKPVWGIDLGQCALKAIRLQATGDGVEAIEHAYIEHKKILSAPDADRKALIETAMNKFREDHDLAGEPIVVAVPGQNTLSRFTKLPPVDKKKIPEIVKYEAQQQIPFDMDEVIWDYQVFEDKDATETEVGIFAMRRELLREHLQFLSNLNLEPTAVQSAPLAMFNALKYEGVIGSEAVVILDIGARNTELIVTEGNSLWTRNIPIGGNHFTEALVKTFKLSFRKAENLKREAAKSKYARQIFQAMRSVFADLVAEIQRSIGFYTSSRRGVKLHKVIAMGNAFRLPGMQKFLQQNLSMEVVRPSTFKKLNASNARNAPELLDRLLSYSVAYGLALQGLGQAQITSNLLPSEIAKQVIWRKKTPWFYGAAACLALSAGIIWGRNMLDQGTVEAAREGQQNFSYRIQGEDDNPQPDPQAVRVIQQGPTADTPYAMANQVIAAGRHMQDVLSKITSLNNDLISEAKKLHKLQAEKTTWPQIFDLVLSSLPRPQEALYEAIQKGPNAFKQVAANIPRGQREVVFIKNIEVKYSPDVMSEMGAQAQDQGGMGRGRRGGGGGAKKGFILNIYGRTPNQGGPKFLTEDFIARLKNPRSQYENIYIDPASINMIKCQQIKKLESGGGSSPGRGRGRRSVSPGFTRQQTDVDPITGESIADDYQFHIECAVVLGKKPKSAQQGQERTGRGSGRAPTGMPGI